MNRVSAVSAADFYEMYQNFETLIPALNLMKINQWVEKEGGNWTTDRPEAQSTSVVSFGKKK